MRYGRCSRCGRPVSWQTGWSELLETRIGSGIESPNADPRSPSSGSKPDQWPHTAQRHDCWHNVPNRPNRHRDPERHGLTAPLTVKAEAAPMNREVWYKWSVVNYEFPGTERTAGKTIKVTWYDGEGKLPAREKLGVAD